MGYELPKVKSGIDKSWKNQKFLMIGGAGVGKSTFWSFSESPLYLEAEAGLNFIDVFKMPCRSWTDVNGAMGALHSVKGDFPYDLVVVDTLDRILVAIESEVMEWAKGKYSKGREYSCIGDIPEGAGWYAREGMMLKFLKGLEALPCAIALIGHVTDKEIKNEGVNSYHKATINIGGKMGGGILAWSDHTLHVVGKMQGDKLKRTVYTKPTQSREAKSRGGMVKDGWVWSDNDEENFKQLRSQFT